MRRNPRPVDGDRRGVAAVELAIALPVVLIMLFGIADAVQLARMNLRVQSAAIQVGQIVSQCESINANDETALNDLTKRILDPHSTRNSPYALRITVFGRDSANKDFTPWSISQTTTVAGQPAMTIASDGSTVPAGYTMGRNQVLFRTEIYTLVDKTPLQRTLALLSSPTRSSGAVTFGYMTAKGSAVLSTRQANTDGLKTKGGTAAQGCLT